MNQSSGISRIRAHHAKFATAGALALTLGAALTLAGCGRKGGLDAPPMAAAGDVQAPNQAAQAPGQPAATTGATAAQQQPEKRNTFLDWLIN